MLTDDSDSDSSQWLDSAPAQVDYLACKAQLKTIRKLLASDSAADREAASAKAHDFWTSLTSRVQTIGAVYLQRCKALDADLGVIEQLLRSPTTVEEVEQTLRSAATAANAPQTELQSRERSPFQIGFAGFLAAGRQVDDLRKVFRASPLECRFAQHAVAFCSLLQSTASLC